MVTALPGALAEYDKLAAIGGTQVAEFVRFLPENPECAWEFAHNITSRHGDDVLDEDFVRTWEELVTDPLELAAEFEQGALRSGRLSHTT